jgi:NADH-quinone oxidoreductase subunit H
MKFALFFMAEYQKMIVICAIAATLYFGGFREFGFLHNTIFSVDYTWTLGSWQITNWFLGPIYLLLKVIVLLFGMIWVRATWPRIRYDRLMAFGWKVLLPLSLAITFITAAGISLMEIYDNRLFFWAIPVVSIIVGLFTVVFIYRELRRKAYERA